MKKESIKKIVNRIIETHKDRQKYKKMYSKLEGTYREYIGIRDRYEMLKLLVSVVVLIIAATGFFFYYKDKNPINIGVVDSVLASLITGALLILVNPIINRFKSKN